MGFLSDLLGTTAADAARKAGELQGDVAGEQGLAVGQAGQSAQDLFNPFQQVGQRGVDLSGFLGDPQAQFDFLQSNPLFQSALENANQATLGSAASRGRLTSGDTLQQLSANTMLTAQPLIDRQRADISQLLGIGQNTAGAQAQIGQNTAAQVADLLTGGAAAQAGGIVGQANARGARAGNVINLGGQILGMPTSGTAGTIGGSIFGTGG